MQESEFDAKKGRGSGSFAKNVILAGIVAAVILLDASLHLYWGSQIESLSKELKEVRYEAKRLSLFVVDQVRDYVES